MNIQTLPTAAPSILALTWNNYEPYFTVPLPELFATAGVKFAFDTETLKEAVDLIEEVIGEMEAKP